MQRYYIWTIGCQMNTADSERLAGALEQLGLSPVDTAEEADVVVLNSCVVRQGAEEKVVGRLSTLRPLKTHAPDKVIALMGCMVPPRTDELQRRFPYVDLFMQPQQFGPLVELVRSAKGTGEGCLELPLPPRPQVSTHVPVIHGCDLFCTFCIIPYRRGRQVSRPVEEIVRECQMLAQRGVKEVTLLGQTVDAYGLDLPERPDLADLFYAVHEVPGIERIRFLTSHPNFMSQRILRAIAELPKVCEHVNLPVQAGDDQVLERMRRHYTVADYKALITRICEAIPDVSLSTDVIVGFCGETEGQFQNTVTLLEELRFDKVHVAPYSTRPGTIAARKLQDTVPWEEKRRRVKAIEQLQERIATELNARLVGRTEEVLVEGQQNGKWFGRTRSNKLVFFPYHRDLTGQLVKVRIEKSSPWSLQGFLGLPLASRAVGGDNGLDRSTIRAQDS
jgi:tRNA-2-methylthio-N6-dimethylallyladenosine synthase